MMKVKGDKILGQPNAGLNKPSEGKRGLPRITGKKGAEARPGTKKEDQDSKLTVEY